MRLKREKRICSVLFMIVLLCSHPFSACASDYLVVSSGIADDIAIPLFEAKHPEVSVTIDPVSPLYSELANKFIGKDNHVDLYRLNANLGIHQYLRTKGYFLDLSSDATIKSFTDRIAHPFREQVLLENGMILGVPSFLILEYPILINRSVADSIGLSEENFPSSILELLRFVNSWEENYGEEFPDYAPFRADEASSYALAHRNPYIGLVLEMYKDTFTAQGQPLKYDTPLFHELLGEIERWTYVDDRDYAVKTGELPDYDHCLFYSFQAFDDEVLKWVCKDDSYLNLPLTSESPIVQAYELECAIVNPATNIPELAVELARCYVEDCQPALLRLLCPDESTPYQSPHYQENLEELQRWREEEEQKLKIFNPENKQEQKELLTLIDTLLQNELDNPYEITASAISRYKADILPYLVARGEGIYESEAIYAETMSYTVQWLNGALSAEAYSKKLDGFLELAIAESD